MLDHRRKADGLLSLYMVIIGDNGKDKVIVYIDQSSNNYE